MTEFGTSFVPNGAPCTACGEPLTEEHVDAGFSVDCSACGELHIYHGECIPEELRVMATMARARMNARYN